MSGPDISPGCLPVRRYFTVLAGAGATGGRISCGVTGDAAGTGCCCCTDGAAPASAVGIDVDDVEPFPNGEMCCKGRPAFSASKRRVEGLADDVPLEPESGLPVYSPARRVGGDLPEMADD